MRPLLRLYVAGHSEASLAAIRHVRRVCQSESGRGYRLEIIDVLLSPEAAEADGIIATPTLVRAEPKPVVRLIGNLSHHHAVLEALGLQTTDSAAHSSSQKAQDFLFD